MKIRTQALPIKTSIRLQLAAAATALALFAIPHLAHAQGVFNGMERRSGGFNAYGYHANGLAE